MEHSSNINHVVFSVLKSTSKFQRTLVPKIKIPYWASKSSGVNWIGCPRKISKIPSFMSVLNLKKKVYSLKMPQKKPTSRAKKRLCEISFSTRAAPPISSSSPNTTTNHHRQKWHCFLSANAFWPCKPEAEWSDRQAQSTGYQVIQFQTKPPDEKYNFSSQGKSHLK